MSGQYVLRVLSFRSLLERHLIERFSKATITQKRFYDDIQLWTNLDAALSYWKQWLSDDKFTCSYQLYNQQLARRRLEDEFIQLTMPDRDIERYVTSATTQPPDSNLTYSKWGYLFVKVSRHSWSRKWFYLHGGYFGSGQVDKTKTSMTSDLRVRLTECEVNIALDSDRRFCFEVIVANPPASLILQAETEDELKSWIQVFSQNKKPVQLRDSAMSTPSAHHSQNTQDLTLSQESSVVMVSTTPDIHATLASSLSLTPLLVWEAARAGNSPIQQLPSGSWGIPWSLVPTMVNLTEDNIVQDNNNQTPLPHTIWPPKAISVNVPNVEINGYTDKMNSLNKELRQLFSGVESQEIVLDMFVCCLRKKSTVSLKDQIKEIQMSKSIMNSPCADLYEDELIHRLSRTDNLDPPSEYGYAYTGRGFITQTTFWFYSCVLMTCIHSIAIQLKDIDEIKVIKDGSLGKPVHDTAMAMKSDMLISISLVANTQSETKEPLIFGFMMDDVQVIAESLKMAVENAKSKEVITFNSALSQIKETSENQPSTVVITRPHAATIGPESTVKIEEILKPTSRQRGDSEPPRPIAETRAVPTTFVTETSKPDPDMPPANIECPKGPVECNCDDHLDRQDIQINLPISAKRLFELMFTDEQNAPPTDGGVWNQKTAAIEGHDLSVTKWSPVEGKMQRILKYWMPVANPIVRLKEAEVVETQILINKEDYIRYTVQISTKTAALPYADAFIPSVRYCITWVNKSECQLTCYLGVRWVKSVLVRAIVTRAALSGMSESVQVFIPILTEASNQIKEKVDEERRQQIEYNTSLLSRPFTENPKKPLDDIDEAYRFGCPAIPIVLSKSHSVYLRDLDKGIFTHATQSPPYAQTRSFQTFLELKQTDLIPPELDYVNDRHWYDFEHYKLAVDLFNSRERLALLRHDLISMFQTLNQRDAYLFEKEYLNWLMDTQLKCNHYPDLSPEDPRYQKATLLCQEIVEQLTQYNFVAE
ncbi:hypothetical protein EDC96DRAFT_437703 [Choanephora cucurbitarum]|nr:hypothetical protein EDC96DRAFT_437703 [Choanephora cucurbitarum]